MNVNKQFIVSNTSGLNNQNYSTYVYVCKCNMYAELRMQMDGNLFSILSLNLTVSF